MLGHSNVNISDFNSFWGFLGHPVELIKYSYALHHQHAYNIYISYDCKFFFYILRLLNFSLSNDYESLGIGLPGRKSEMVNQIDSATFNI